MQVSAGDYHSLALCRNGSVFAFDSSGRGQLGDGTWHHRSDATRVLGLDEGFTKVAAGGLHSLALHAEGFVLVWGDNSTGQVGQSLCAFEDEAVIRHRGWPIHVAAPVMPRFVDEDVVDIAAGHLHSLALLSDGRILAWGNNIYGQLGIGKNLTFPPYDVEDEDDLESRSDAFQRCRRDQIAAFENVPMKVLMPPLSGARRRRGVIASAGVRSRDEGRGGAGGVLRVKRIAAGGWHSLALVSCELTKEVQASEGGRGGGVYSWGQNYLGQLGTGDFTCWDMFDDSEEDEEEGQRDQEEEEDSDFEPRPKSKRAGAKRGDDMGVGDLTELKGATSLFHSEEESEQGWAAGSKRGGCARAGGGWNDLLEPRLCLSHDSLQSEVIDIAAGYQHSLALLANGSVLSWGSNQAGQLGVSLQDNGLQRRHPDNGMPFRAGPALVEGLPGPAVAIAAGYAHSAGEGLGFRV